MTLKLVAATAYHADAIGRDLRAGDWMELRAMGFKNGVDAFLFCLSAHEGSVTCLEDGWPIAAWGYQPDSMILASSANLWCFTTPAVERHKKAILRYSREFCDGLLSRFARLECTVSPDYPQAWRWAYWLGFRPHAGEGEIVLNGVRFVNIAILKEI